MSIKGIDEDKIVSLTLIFFYKIVAITAVDGDSVIFRELEIPPCHLDDMGGIVDGINGAFRQVMLKKTDKRPGADTDDQDVSWVVVYKQWQYHIAGVWQNQILRAGQ